jgi:hypothetical protein
MNKNRWPCDIAEGMTEYVLYTRNRAGDITRRSSYPVFWCYESLVPYVHEEPLIGWPEFRVFWARQTGPSIGIAPSRPL